MNEINQILKWFQLSPVTLNKTTWFSIALDILIVAYVLYKVIKWVKETRAWSLFKGLFVLILIYGLSSLLQLYTIQWILDNVIMYGIIAMIIIFQPEIRKALEQLGKGKIVAIFNSGEDVSDNALSAQSIEEIITAVFAMAKVRTGALIAIQHQVSLGEQESTGISLDSNITKQLLINIFEDKTPLHDGGVIIKQNRIAAASCIFPLTATEIGSELGTRHRAAVGASEISDAIVIVVSEETGTVSIAENGKLHRAQSEQSLNNLLNGNKKPSKRKNILRKGRSKK